MAFRGDLEALILAILSDGPRHGYEISKSISSLSKRTLAYGEGQLYPALHKLEEAGDIRAEWAHQEQRPPRKVYAITETGATKLAKKKAEWAQFQESVTAILGAMPTVEASRG